MAPLAYDPDEYVYSNAGINTAGRIVGGGEWDELRGLRRSACSGRLHEDTTWRPTEAQ